MKGLITDSIIQVFIVALAVDEIWTPVVEGQSFRLALSFELDTGGNTMIT